MKTKKLYILVIIAGCLLVLGALFIMLARKSMSSGGDVMSTRDFVLIGIGTLCSCSFFIIVFCIIFSILKEKKII